MGQQVIVFKPPGDLTKAPAGSLFKRITPMLTYLVRLRKRMVDKQFDGNDEERRTPDKPR